MAVRKPTERNGVESFTPNIWHRKMEAIKRYGEDLNNKFGIIDLESKAKMC